ncbi:glutamate--tRNA ligase [[Eubacterium] cellulosolvens]
MVEDDELVRIIRKFALYNALKHNGHANSKAVLGKLMSEHAELRAKAKELLVRVDAVVADINSKSESAIRTELEALAPELVHKKKVEKVLVLPELPNIKPGSQVVMRFAPGPSGPLHIGHTRAVILNDEYVKRYSGKFIIRFEDTNPQNIEPSAYDMILEDLAWLGIKYTETYRQSDRFDLYYDWAKKLLELGKAYVCTCPVEHWRDLKANSQPCPHRAQPVNDQLVRWEKMLVREYEPGEASLIVKTDLNHSNPAVRDFVGFRMVNQPHPLTQDKFYVYPTYNFSVAVDDHLMGMTHILRGKDHLNNTYRQRYIYEYLNWPTPEFIHYGWVSMPKVILKTSEIKEGIKTGKYSDWSDIRLGTLQALAHRGIRPEALRKYWMDVGIKEVDITFSWETLYALNKEIIDPIANRYFFVWEPIRLNIIGVSELTSHAPLHPDDPSRGFRELILSAAGGLDDEEPCISVYITRSDLANQQPGTKARLKDLCNIELTTIDLDHESYAEYIGNDLEILKEGAKIYHWVPFADNYSAEIYNTDGTLMTGYCETPVADALEKMVQFERFGFVQLGDTTQPITGWFAHK